MDDSARTQPDPPPAPPAKPPVSPSGAPSGAPSLLPLPDVAPAPVVPSVFGVTDVGLVRDHNEDSFLVAELERSMRIFQTSRPGQDGAHVPGPPQGHLLMVADGMGGHAAGEVASAMTIDVLSSYAFTLMPWTLPRSRSDSRVLAQGLREAVRICQHRMKEATQVGIGQRGMGTTLTMAYVTWPNLYVVHVGDSRMYAYRDSQLFQITRDHTLAQQLVDNKVIKPEDVETSEFSHILVNALGGESDDLQVELHHALLFPGDVLMLCSDGLTKHVATTEVAQLMGEAAGGANVEAVAKNLIERAKAGGGTDNVTVVVARF